MRAKYYFLAVIMIFLLMVAGCKPSRHAYALILHGGAGQITPATLNDSMQHEYTKMLEAARDSGLRVLANGGSSLDAVQKVINILEDCPLFNAGKGACYTYDGKISLDAAIMDGSNLKAGAVAGVSDVKNPITLARRVMTSSPHVMLSGEGASEFARSQGIEMADSAYFYTERQWKAHLRGLDKLHKMGTVGCVALDQYGNIAAGTSTGGITNKRWGRIGDSPIIGAGTYADNKTCGVSCTGTGEYFIRLDVAKDVSSLVDYRKMKLQDAADLVIQKKLAALGGTGGLVSLDKNGNPGISFNTEGMFRAYGNSDGKKFSGMFK